MHAGEALYLLNAVIDYHGQSSGHPGNQAQVQAARQALSVLFQTLQIPPPTPPANEQWLQHVKGIYTQAVNTAPQRQQSSPTVDLSVLHGFMDVAQGIIKKCDLLTSANNEPEAMSFASELQKRAQSMLSWMESKQHVTAKMEAALTNMNEAVDRWLEPRSKVPRDDEPDDDNIPF